MSCIRLTDCLEARSGTLSLSGVWTRDRTDVPHGRNEACTTWQRGRRRGGGGPEQPRISGGAAVLAKSTWGDFIDGDT